MHHFKRTTALALVFGLLIAGCGTSASNSSGGTSAASAETSSSAASSSSEAASETAGNEKAQEAVSEVSENMQESETAGGNIVDSLAEQESGAGQSGAAAAGPLKPLKAEKSASIALEMNASDISESGIIYSDANGKYGVISPDGSKDTGAVYASARAASSEYPGYFSVISGNAQAGDLNVTGLIDAEGKEIIPMKYGFISLLNDRYAKVVTAEGETTDEKKALFYRTESAISFQPGEDDTMYAGTWQIFDLEKNAFVNGVSGTLAYKINVQGPFITYVTDEEKEITVDQDGSEITDERRLFNDGFYELIADGTGHVYAPDGKELFTYDYSKNYISNEYSGYFVVSESGSDKTWLLDQTGSKAAGDFGGTTGTIFPEYVLAGDQICDYNGKSLFDGSYSQLIYDAVNGDAYQTQNDSAFTVFASDGTVLYQDSNADDDIYHNYFTIGKHNDDFGYTFYNYATGEFSIKGSDIGTQTWLVSRDDEDTHSLVDTRTGNTLLEGYDQFAAQNNKADEVTYIYAFRGGSCDVYKVKAA